MRVSRSDNPAAACVLSGGPQPRAHVQTHIVLVSCTRWTLGQSWASRPFGDDVFSVWDSHLSPPSHLLTHLPLPKYWRNSYPYFKIQLNDQFFFFLY